MFAGHDEGCKPVLNQSRFQTSFTYFIKMVPAPIEGSTFQASADMELTFESFYIF